MVVLTQKVDDREQRANKPQEPAIAAAAIAAQRQRR
jgi:hypothetical protein